MNREEFEQIFPYKEQSIMVFVYTAFIELLKYQKSIILNKTNDDDVNKILWITYLDGILHSIKGDLAELKGDE